MGWLPPSPDRIAMCAKVVVRNPRSGEGGNMEDTMIGVDLAKSVFVLHGASMTGQVKYRKKLSRSQFLKRMADQSPAGRGDGILRQRALLGSSDDGTRP